MANIKKFTVTATAEVDMDQVQKLRARIEAEPPGSQSREKVWNELQALQAATLQRLKGELNAYENAARHQVMEAFKI